MKNTFLILIILFFTLSVILPQNKLDNYKTTTSQISFIYTFKTIKYKKQKAINGRTEILFGNYQDESEPGNFSLPAKELFIALPSYSKVTVNIIPEKINKIKGIPQINPAVKMESDSSVIYNYSDGNKPNKPAVIKPLFSVKGYLWIGNYYSVHITVNQYRFNNRDIIEELNQAEIQIKILNPGNTKLLPNPTKQNHISDVVINKKYAVELDRKYYEQNEKNTTYDWINFNTTYLKLGVAADGVYRITKQDLLDFNISTSSVDPRKFNLFYKGKTIPVFVKGEADGTFDNNDYIEFFGKRNWGDKYRETSNENEHYKNYLNLYSDTTIYWLTWDPLLPPNRIDSLRQFSNLPQDTIKYYNEVVHYERDNWLDYSIPGIVDRQDTEWRQNETWVWNQQGVGAVNRTFTVSDVYPNSIAEAFYKVQSFASDGFLDAHKIGLSINNDPSVYDSSSFNKYRQKVVKASFNSNLLNEGNNILKTISFPTNTTINSILYDWYEVEYPRYLKAIKDSLKFKFDSQADSGFKFIKITNIGSGNIILYKFNSVLKRITNYTINQNTLVFADTVKQGDAYYLIRENKIQKPKFYYTKKFNNLASNSNQADYILITHPKFIQKSNEYLSFIRSQYNVGTKLINVFDIYDQYNYGFFSPEPIREFLHSAFLNWKSPKPKYVFLVGDATYDYYGNKTKYFSAPGQINYVPSFGHPVSDTWFTIWDSTEAFIPQMYISRLPVNSVEEFERYFTVHRDYVNKPYSEFNKKYLLFSSGENDNPLELNTLKSANDYVDTAIVSRAPTGGIVRHLYKTTNPIRNFGPYTNKQVEKYIGEGGVFISYIGHSGVQIWDNGISSPVQLKNINGNHSLISDWGCSTGKFAEPDIKAFSELFIIGPDGGAINYNGNSSLGFTSTATIFPKIFYSKILNEGYTNVAEAHTLSKIDLIQQYGANNVNKIFVLSNTLFGDPIVSLKVPPKPNLKISENDILVNTSAVDDSKDYLPVKINYSNLGRVEEKNFSIKVIDEYTDSTVYEETFTKDMPLQSDSLQINLPVKNLSGVHRLTVTLDKDNEIEELNKNDNTVSTNIDVVSASVRAILPSADYNQINGTLRFLNPSNKPVSNSFKIKISDNMAFGNSRTITVPFDTFYTDVNLKQYFNSGRIWVRSKVKGSGEYGSTNTFVIGNKNNFLFSDSLSYLNSEVQNVKFSKGNLHLDSAKVNFKVISGGFNDGNAVVIQKDKQDYVTSNTQRGHSVVLFKIDDYSFIKYYHFDIFADPTKVNDYINLLDTLDNSYLVLIGIKDEGSVNLTAGLRNKIKEFGSVFIDSLGFRNSWALIGRRGAVPGSVPESFKKTFKGKAIVDTTINIRYNSGFIKTTLLGPVSTWNNLETVEQLPFGTSVTYQPIGIKKNGEEDTLSVLQLVNNKADLSVIDSKVYPQIRILAELKSSNGIASPKINKLEINYEKLPELGINYQTVSFDADSLSPGESINLNFDVVNAGYKNADSVEIKVVDIAESNDQKLLLKEKVNIDQNEGRKFNLNFSAGNIIGNHKVVIQVDKDGIIKELFEDNNQYILSYSVKADSTKPEIQITFNDQQILDNDYVSTNPEIKIELNSNSPSPITDTSAVSISLNNKPVYFADNTINLNYVINSDNPKFIAFYKPLLKEGRYTLKVTGKSSTTPFANSTIVKKSFTVSNNLQLLDVYNYPNPFSAFTYFTFKLTRIPDILKIKIFTVAGRLVKEMNLTSRELSYDFNRIYWNGRDRDGDLLANGTYLYKVILYDENKTKSVIQKLAIIR